MVACPRFWNQAEPCSGCFASRVRLPMRLLAFRRSFYDVNEQSLGFGRCAAPRKSHCVPSAGSSQTLAQVRVAHDRAKAIRNGFGIIRIEENSPFPRNLAKDGYVRADDRVSQCL